ncbi:MAG: NAD-dependent deacetylase [Rhodocyclaceae bacterium]|nr:NAD-dependent deacetylase [Rhodocyclaceae bacterium]MBX3669077.1 NAD-dependent deacetylase [Rhodocyclaceae bacterium]
MSTPFERCAEYIAAADSIVICAGAGMGVDSGLPDFRGPSGFWRAYPALGQARIAFEEIANPAAFERDPQLAWGFYGHRLALYRNTQPHAGFAILNAIAGRLPHGAFVFTSNVDGQFQLGGSAPERVVECHGSIHRLQCANVCSDDIWPAEFEPLLDQANCRMLGELPACPRCGGLARPNVLMFGDWNWIPRYTEEQRHRMHDWLYAVGRPVVIELGAGTQVPTVRMTAEYLGAPILRINPREPQLPAGRGESLALGALEALRGIEAALAAGGFFAA